MESHLTDVYRCLTCQRITKQGFSQFVFDLGVFAFTSHCAGSKVLKVSLRSLKVTLFLSSLCTSSPQAHCLSPAVRTQTLPPTEEAVKG